MIYTVHNILNFSNHILRTRIGELFEVPALDSPINREGIVIFVFWYCKKHYFELLELKTENWSFGQDSLTFLVQLMQLMLLRPSSPPPHSSQNYSTEPVLFSSPRLLFILYYTILCRKLSAAEGPTTSRPSSFYGVFKGLEVLQEISLFRTTVDLANLI